jgi:outer membrane receptor protein involved in Fe transport
MKQTVLKLTSSLLLGIGAGLCATYVSAQDTEPQAERRSFHVAPSSILSKTTPIIDVARDAEAQDFEGAMVEEALNFNLGVKITPIEGLNLQADAWLQEIADAPAVTVNTAAQSALPELFIEDSAINEFNIQNPLIGTQLQSNGFDLGASYVWDTSRFGQFTLSTKATYVQSFENNGSLLELLDTEAATLDDRVISPEFQSSLMLTWQLGNHSAKAITNYFDSFKDVSELDLEEINALIDDITTVDLQYGNSVETSSNNRAIISFGIRNIFDEKTAQILNSSTRILDQNGRIAYGSIKYQF